MNDYLVVDGWNGPRKIRVNIIGETAEGFNIEALERVFLPGRGMLKGRAVHLRFEECHNLGAARPAQSGVTNLLRHLYQSGQTHPTRWRHGGC